MFASAVLTTASSALGQVSQNFDGVASLHTLTGACWQFMGATVATASTNNKSLALKAPYADGTAWIRTAFIELTATSNISFSYRLEEALPAGASRRIYVRLLDINGDYTSLASIVLDHQSATAPLFFSATSPISGVKRLVIEVTASGSETTALHVDNIAVDGNYELNAPYGCKAEGEGNTSIHYLKNFKGALFGNKVQLQWTVAENENNKYFEVEKSSDGKEFKSLATMQSTEKKGDESYQFTDALQGQGYYRLKLVNNNNIRMYSNVTYFKTNTIGSNEVTLFQNPVQQNIKFGFTSETKAVGMITVYDLSGRKILQRSQEVVKGYNMMNIPVEMYLSRGMYLLEVVYDNNRLTTKLRKD